MRQRCWLLPLHITCADAFICVVPCICECVLFVRVHLCSEIERVAHSFAHLRLYVCLRVQGCGM